MPDTNYKSLLESLKTNATTIELDGAQIELRDCADRVRGELDPRTAAAGRATREDFAVPGKVHSELCANYDKLMGPPHLEEYDALSIIRYTFGWRSTDISQGVATKRHILHAAGRPFTLYQYRGDAVKPGAPCMVFIHGGGFVAGDIQTVENQCKLLAQMTGGVVFSVDYPLAPEYPFPQGYEACKAALDWVYENADALGIDSGKIGVGGDSAGGNLSLALSLADRDAGTNKIAYQCLIYPGLGIAPNAGDGFYTWSADIYENTKNDPIIDKEIRAIGDTSKGVADWYQQNEADAANPLANPILGGCEGLPKTLLLYAEYDTLRVGCDAYAGMLARAGVDVKSIRYGGITHGTFDRLGYAPQVEDMLLEMAALMESL